MSKLPAPSADFCHIWQPILVSSPRRRSFVSSIHAMAEYSPLRKRSTPCGVHKSTDKRSIKNIGRNYLSLNSVTRRATNMHTSRQATQTSTDQKTPHEPHRLASAEQGQFGLDSACHCSVPIICFTCTSSKLIAPPTTQGPAVATLSLCFYPSSLVRLRRRRRPLELYLAGRQCPL